MHVVKKRNEEARRAKAQQLEKEAAQRQRPRLQLTKVGTSNA